MASGARESGGDLLSRARRPGTIGDRRLDFRVRNGNGYDPPSMTAEISKLSTGGKGFRKRTREARLRWAPRGAGLPTRGKSHVAEIKEKPHGLLVPLGSTCRHAYTCGLSTS